MSYKPSEMEKSAFWGKSNSFREKESLEWWKSNAVHEGDNIEDWGKKILQQGKIYVFNYDPITKDELDWYDKNPMVLSLGILQRKGKWRNILDLGVNLHFIPTELRKHLLDFIYDLNKSTIDREISLNKSAGEQAILRVIEYDRIKSFLKRYGFDFALRSYYRQKRREVKTIPYKDWYKTLNLKQEDVVGATIQQIYHSFHQKRSKS